MKKLFSLLSLFAICNFVNAQTISVADIEILQGQKTGSFTISASVGGAVYNGFEFTISFPKDKGFIKISNATAAWENGVIMSGDLADGSCDFSGFTSGDGQIVTGEVGTVTFEVDEAIEIDDYEVSITNFTFMDGTNYIPANDVTFKVKVTDRLTLDEYSTVLPSAVSGANVKVKRTINANTWSTICLPFDMDKDQVENVFGDDVQLAEYKNHQIDDTTTPINIAMNFESVDLDADGFYANCPYLIKTSKDVTEFSVNNVDIDPDEDEAIAEYNNGKRGSNKVVYGIFKGIYRAETIVPNKCFFLNNSEFYFSTGKTEMKAFRGYFELYNLPVSSNARVLLSIVDNDGNTTKIDGRTMEPIETGKVYNISGQYVGEAEKTDRLPKGIYIVNGKKKVIK